MVGAVVVVVAVATALVGRFQPLGPGPGWGPVTASGDAWVVEPPLAERQLVVVRNDHGAAVDLRTSLTNHGRVAVTVDLEATLASFQADHDPSCWWWPERLTATTTGWDGETVETLPATFRLEPGRHVMLDVEGTVGGGPGARPCTMAGLVSRDVDVPVRFTVAGLPRTQTIATPFVLALGDDPAPWLEAQVTPAEAAPPR